MNTRIVLSTAVLIFSLPLFSQNYYQQGFFIRGGASYTLSQPYSIPFNNWENRTLTDSTLDIQVNYFSPGSGAFAHFGFGYQINDIFRFGLDVAYQFNSSSTVKDVYTTRIDTLDFTFESPRTLTSNAFLFTPEVTFMLPMEYITRPYIRVGFPIIVGVIQEKSSVLLPNNSNFYDFIEMQTNYIGRFSLGLSGALGIEWSLDDRLFLFTEVRALGANFSPRRSELVFYEVNGQGQLNQFARYERETVYDRNIRITDQDEIIANEPSKARPFSLPFNHIGFSVGLTVQLF
ncbi:hypothetical protein JCM31826_01160 [Thermaurantimonas aggregans]|uniref:Outer membrane protein beta-barrel domain-containing protein n=1 Tax=Thermaurantimonas aggregans TaxID=2173829 RepID=A0A401XI27_9FLAO|nr:hypothetical protein [Thermaurantimonas aggregans]MCX8149192.1 hypothetical protein [Thermaurantimonas aggregans]GCD76634.1 hypothetical protein JCM31826_01160 [Thermaurantimonas aggregans]